MSVISSSPYSSSSSLRTWDDEAASVDAEYKEHLLLEELY